MRLPASLQEYFERTRRSLQRDWQDFRTHRPTDFARTLVRGRTGCRYLLAQYQSPVPRRTQLLTRLQNLKVLEPRLDETVIDPGQILSFYRLVRSWRPRPGSAPTLGFQLGPHLMPGGVSQSREAGFGQAASVLYCLAILCNLEILEHTPSTVIRKSFNLEYVPLGLEACVSWPSYDLRIRNPHNARLALQFQVAEENVIATLYGSVPLGQKASLRVEHDTRPDGSVKARIHRLILEGDGAGSDQLVSERIYQPPASTLAP